MEDVLEFRTQLQDVAFFDSEVSGEAHRFRRLPLPTVVAVVRCGGAPGSSRSIAECLRIQYLGGLGIKAPAVGVNQQEGLSGWVLEVYSATTVPASPAQLVDEVVKRAGRLNECTALIAEARLPNCQSRATWDRTFIPKLVAENFGVV